MLVNFKWLLVASTTVKLNTDYKEQGNKQKVSNITLSFLNNEIVLNQHEWQTSLGMNLKHHSSRIISCTDIVCKSELFWAVSQYK